MPNNPDVLNPSTYWVGNRCYRVLTHHIDTASAYNTYVEEDEYADEVADFLGAGEDEEQNHEFSVDKLTNGLYRTAWHVPKIAMSVYDHYRNQRRPLVRRNHYAGLHRAATNCPVSGCVRYAGYEHNVKALKMK